MSDSLIKKALDDLTRLKKAERVEMVQNLQQELAEAIKAAVTEPAKPKLSAQHLEMVVRQAAVHFSEIRRINHIFFEHRQRLQDLKNVPSTDEEMLSDWHEACAFAALQIFEGPEITFAQVEPASYPLLEDVWLKTIERLKAYYIWKTADSGRAEQNYYLATEAIRKLFLNKPRLNLADFQKAQSYIEKHYLDGANQGKLDDSKPSTNRLIASKADRIWQTTRDADSDANWFRARLYVAMFYENIIGAVINNDKQRTLSILKAFQFSKAPEHRYLIINGFETALAISFLNKDIVKEVLQNPELYDFSLQPVKDWPTDVSLPEICQNNIRYDMKQKQLVCDGVMTEEQKRALLGVFSNSGHQSAIEGLYQQSRLGPFEKMIL